MIDQLPEGKSIGWMQAPPQWIFTHTVRFIGVVRVVIQDGEGFILIKKGKPLMYFFKHGRIELHGHGALDYFNSHPTIEFNLCKYTPEEFAQALKICDVEEPAPETDGMQEPPPAPSARADIVEKTAEEIPVITRPVPGQPLPVQPEITYDEVEPSLAAVPVSLGSAVPVKSVPPVPARPQSVVSERPLVPQPAVLEDPDIKIIGQIKKLNGIVAISVFNEDRNILLMGDVEIEPLLKIARTMLATANKITPHLDWGSFVHMTLQIPEGNVIIAPYNEKHLCILTTRTINIGHIRRILRDLQQDRNQGDML
jgi:predicted regulator of Ras-like GTPase activity (Roadblock/LC7/MglB family)